MPTKQENLYTAQSEEHVIQEQCPMVVIQKIMGGKWKLLILWYIGEDILRFNELKKKLPPITQKMLTQQLRSLEDDGLIHREVYPVVPPKVEYSLTALGKRLLPILSNMYEYGEAYINEIKK